VLRLSALLLTLRTGGKARRGAAGALFSALVCILLVALSRHVTFLWAAGALLLALLAMQPPVAIRVSLLRAGAAFIAALIFMLPTLLLSGGYLLFLPVKAFLSVLALSLLTGHFEAHALTGALASFRVPGVFIATLDFTLKFIFILGRRAEEMLMALHLRAVGHDRRPRRAMAGILGALFLRAQEVAGDTYLAMRARGYTGDYPRRAWEVRDALYLLPSLLLAAMYLYLT